MEVIITFFTSQRVAAVLPIKIIITFAAIESIDSGAAVEFVVAAVSSNDIVAVIAA